MKIRQFSKAEISKLSDTENDAILIVESQPYGQDDDIAFNAVLPDELDENFSNRKIGRSIKDAGRTTGFFQQLGGSGVFNPTKASYHFPKQVGDILSRMNPARISIEGETWAEILPKVPFLKPEFLNTLNIQKAESTPKKNRKSKKS